MVDFKCINLLLILFLWHHTLLPLPKMLQENSDDGKEALPTTELILCHFAPSLYNKWQNEGVIPFLILKGVRASGANITTQVFQGGEFAVPNRLLIYLIICINKFLQNTNSMLYRIIILRFIKMYTICSQIISIGKLK